MFTIVYPKESFKGAIYPAVTLQYLFWKKGITLPLSTERTAGAAEVVIQECDGAEKGAFAAVTEGNSLVVSASDMFGFIAASDYLTKELFADAVAVVPKVTHVGKYQMAMHDEKAAELRVMYHNVWFHDRAPGNNVYGVTGAWYELAEIMTYRPDVVGFNEFVDTWRNDTDIIELLHRCGYEEAKPINIHKNMITPLFYNTKTVKLIEPSCYMLSYGEAFLDENNHTLLPPQKKYYKPTFTRYRTAVSAVFEDLASGKRFGACVTHLESNHYCPHQQPDEGDPLRVEEVKLLIPYLQFFSRKYGVSFSVGGDYNSVVSRVACKTLVEAGFANARELADDKNDVCSCHGYPIYCEELNTYPDYHCSFADHADIVGGYAYAIDQIYTLGEIDVKSYRCLYEKTILCSSDHSPVIMDFNV